MHLQGIQTLKNIRRESSVLHVFEELGGNHGLLEELGMYANTNGW